MFGITHYRSKCIGCNACVEAHPERWRISKKDGKSVLIGGVEKKGIFHTKAPNDEYEKNYMAARNCPVRIIILSE